MAIKDMRTNLKAAKVAGTTDPKRNLIVLSDDGTSYYLIPPGPNGWEDPKWRIDSTDPDYGNLQQLVALGAELAYLPDGTPGMGAICTVVNLKAIIK
jgi:hypothetical protein